MSPFRRIDPMGPSPFGDRISVVQEPPAARPMTEPVGQSPDPQYESGFGEAAMDGPNTHKPDAPFYSWTVLTADTPDGERHWFHVPTDALPITLRPSGDEAGLRAELRMLLAKATNGGDWRVKGGHAADRFQPDGYRYVQFGPSPKAAGGFGTDQLAPADAHLIVFAVNYARAALAAEPAREEPGLARNAILDEAMEVVRSVPTYNDSVRFYRSEVLNRLLGRRVIVAGTADAARLANPDTGS